MIYVHYSTALHMQYACKAVMHEKVTTCVANWYSAGNKVLWLHRPTELEIERHHSPPDVHAG